MNERIAFATVRPPLPHVLKLHDHRNISPRLSNPRRKQTTISIGPAKLGSVNVQTMNKTRRLDEKSAEIAQISIDDPCVETLQSSSYFVVFFISFKQRCYLNIVTLVVLLVTCYCI